MYKTVSLKYSMFYEKDNSVFGESATHISIDDEAGGSYIVLEQFPDDGPQKLKFDLPEFEEFLRIANKLMSEYNLATGVVTKSDLLQYIIEETYSPYGEIYYRFKSLLNGATGTWVDTKEEAIKQAENHINLL